jgi:hypothetical protein
VKCSDIADEHVIELAKRWQDAPMFTDPGVYRALIMEGVPEKVALRKIERLVARHLLEYGTTPHFAWPA